MILVAQDGSGIRAALLELLEEGFRSRDVEKSLRNVGADPVRRAKVLAGIPVRQLAPGYYRFAEYIFWLDDVREAGIEISNLSRDEADGIRNLRSARSEFEHKHPACYKCGTRQQTRFAPQCGSCSTKLQSRAA